MFYTIKKISAYSMIMALIIFIPTTIGAHSFYKVDKGIQITITDYSQEPNKVIFMAGSTPITMQYCLDNGLHPYCIDLNNTNNHSASISYATEGMVITEESEVIRALQHSSFSKSFSLFTLSSLVSIGTSLYILDTSKKELLEIIGENLFNSNVKSDIDPDLVDIPLVNEGIEFFSKIGFNLSKNISNDRGHSIASEVIVEEIKRLYRIGGIKAVFSALDWQRIEKLIYKRTPIATIIALGAACSALCTPFYWLWLRSTNNAIDKAIRTHILNAPQVIMPGETMRVWVFGKQVSDSYSGDLEVFVK